MRSQKTRVVPRRWMVWGVALVAALGGFAATSRPTLAAGADPRTNSEEMGHNQYCDSYGAKQCGTTTGCLTVYGPFLPGAPTPSCRQTKATGEFARPCKTREEEAPLPVLTCCTTEVVCQKTFFYSSLACVSSHVIESMTYADRATDCFGEHRTMDCAKHQPKPDPKP